VSSGEVVYLYELVEKTLNIGKACLVYRILMTNGMKYGIHEGHVEILGRNPLTRLLHVLCSLIMVQVRDV